MSLLRERMRAPLHLGRLEGADGVGAVGNPACGDVLTVYLRLEGDHIQEARFESIGSPYQMATASVLCDCVTGSRITQARRRTRRCILDRLPDLPERHHHLAQLAVEALHRALDALGADDEEDADGGTDHAAACSFVLDLLAREGPLQAAQVEGHAAEQGMELPGSALRLLAGLRREGRVAGAFDADRRAWLWRTAP